MVQSMPNDKALYFTVSTVVDQSQMIELEFCKNQGIQGMHASACLQQQMLWLPRVPHDSHGDHLKHTADYLCASLFLQQPTDYLRCKRLFIDMIFMRI